MIELNKWWQVVLMIVLLVLISGALTVGVGYFFVIGMKLAGG